LSDIRVRNASLHDLQQVTDIYNYYVVHTPITFDLEPFTVEQRTPWFRQFSPFGRYRLFVAERGGQILGYAGTTRFRPKAAYDTTVETTVYCAPKAVAKGIGRRLYTELFAALAQEDIRRIVAGYALPNPASAALHASFGFKTVGFFSENGRKFDRYWDVLWMERPLHLP
jgi:phosphinothricin acetyltransferase